MLKSVVYLIIILTQLSACQQETETSYYPKFSNYTSDIEFQYIFGVHPLHNPQQLFKVFDPMMRYLTKNIKGASFKLEASRNYAAFEKKLYTHQFHFSLPNPFQTINAIDKGYKVFAKMGDDDNFRGIILLRKDSGIRTVSDLKNKAVSYPAPTALAATMMPQYYLQTHGINVVTDLYNRYVGSQESSIMNVYLKQTAAACTWPPIWKSIIKVRPEIAEKVKIAWETKPLINNGLVVLPSVPNKITQQVAKLLTNLHKNKEGRDILSKMELSQFELATNETYQRVRDFITAFDQEVRPIK